MNDRPHEKEQEAVAGNLQLGSKVAIHFLEGILAGINPVVDDIDWGGDAVMFQKTPVCMRDTNDAVNRGSQESESGDMPMMKS